MIMLNNGSFIIDDKWITNEYNDSDFSLIAHVIQGTIERIINEK